MKPFADTAFTPAPGGARGIAAVPAEPGSPLSVALLRPAGLAAEERARWARLSARAAPGNIFAQDWFMEPALRHCASAASLRLAVVRRDSGEWLGVLPVALEAQVGNCPLPSLQSWHATNQFLGTPLVLPGAQKAFWQALLARLDRRPGVALALVCDTLPLDDPATLALASLCAEQGRAIACVGRFTRPALLSPDTPPRDLRAWRKLDQRLDGLERRLTRELGPVSMVRHDGPEESEAWCAAFLALERAGWKGRARSALASAASTAALFRETIRHGHRIGATRLVSLRAGDRIVAMSSLLIAEGHGYGFKMAHDEAWRHCAPGRLLMRRVRRAFAAEAAALFDTCAPAHVPTDALWPDQRTLGTFAVAIGGGTRRAVLAAALAARARWQARAGRRAPDGAGPAD